MDIRAGIARPSEIALRRLVMKKSLIIFLIVVSSFLAINATSVTAQDMQCRKEEISIPIDIPFLKTIYLTIEVRVCREKDRE